MAEEREKEKEVLCCLKDHRRCVSYSEGLEDLLSSIRRVFSDVISNTEGCNLLLQAKSERWGGQFVDVMKEEDIPNQSVLKVIVEKPSPKVSLFVCYREI